MKTKSLANFILTAGGTVTLVVLLYDLYDYDWTEHREFTTIGAWGMKHGALAGIAILFFASLRLRPAPRIAVAALCLSLTVGLYAADLVLVGSNSALAASIFARGSGVTIDARDRIEFLADLHKRGVDAVPAVMLGVILAGDGTGRSSESINVDELMPLGGISGSLSVLCNESGQYVSYTSDEHGFRNPMGIWNSARADLAVVGESFAQGYCVPDGEGFVDLLRPRFPVTLNLGISGQSSLLQLAAIKEYLPRHAPKIVLWVYCEGIDLRDLYNEAMHPLLMRYLDPNFSQRLLSRQPEIDGALRRFVFDTELRAREAKATAKGSSFVEASLGVIKLRNLREKVTLMYGINSDDARVLSMLEQTPHNLFSDALAQAQTVTSSWGGTIYLIYLPSLNRYRNSPRPSEREHTRVLKLVRALGIPVIDIQPEFQAQSDPLSLFPFRRGHYNGRGNQIVAETVLKFLSAHEQGNGAVTSDTRRDAVLTR